MYSFVKRVVAVHEVAVPFVVKTLLVFPAWLGSPA